MEISDVQERFQCITNELSRGPVVMRGRLPDYIGFFLENCEFLSQDLDIINFCVKMDSLEEIIEQKIILDPKDANLRRVMSSRFNDFVLGLPDITLLQALESLGKDRSELMFFRKFPLLRELAVLQSELSNIIVDQVKRTLPDIVVLFMIDGLSSSDFTTYLENSCLSDLQICSTLVDTATITSCAFRNLIYGKANVPISTRLHRLGYTPFGFSYWDRKDELLTNELFYGVIPCRRVSSFNEIADSLEDILSRNDKLYLQVLREGLDSLAHRKRERPNIAGEIDLIMKDVLKIRTPILESGRKGLIFCCPDHGILWKTTDLKLLNKTGAYEDIHERYFTTKTPDEIPEGHRKNFIRFICRDGYIHCLRFPFILRRPKSNSCGVHGGVSIEESLVPFIQMEVE